MMGGIFDQLGGKIIAVVGMAVIAVLIAIALSMTKSGNIPQELLYMSMRIQQIYSGSADYAGLDTTTAMNAGIVPDNLIKGTTVKNAFNGDIIIATGDGDETYTFTLTEIPKDECVTLSTNKMNSWVSISINGTSITDNDVASVINNCTDNSTLIFEGQ